MSPPHLTSGTISHPIFPSHPPGHATCCSEPRSASWLSSPASSQWCQVGFLLLPAAAPSISAPLVERELSEVCTAILSLHQTHCSSPCRVSYHGELAPLPLCPPSIGCCSGLGRELCHPLRPHPQSSQGGGDPDPTQTPSATCGHAHPELLSPHHHMSHV